MIIYVVMIGDYDDHRLVGVCQRQDRAEEIAREAWEAKSSVREAINISAHEEGQMIEYSRSAQSAYQIAYFPAGLVFEAEEGAGYFGLPIPDRLLGSVNHGVKRQLQANDGP